MQRLPQVDLLSISSLHLPEADRVRRSVHTTSDGLSYPLRWILAIRKSHGQAIIQVFKHPVVPGDLIINLRLVIDFAHILAQLLELLFGALQQNHLFAELTGLKVDFDLSISQLFCCEFLLLE